MMRAMQTVVFMRTSWTKHFRQIANMIRNLTHPLRDCDDVYGLSHQRCHFLTPEGAMATVRRSLVPLSSLAICGMRQSEVLVVGAYNAERRSSSMPVRTRRNQSVRYPCQDLSASGRLNPYHTLMK